MTNSSTPRPVPYRAISLAQVFDHMRVFLNRKKDEIFEFKLHVRDDPDASQHTSEPAAIVGLRFNYEEQGKRRCVFAIPTTSSKVKEFHRGPEPEIMVQICSDLPTRRCTTVDLSKFLPLLQSTHVRNDARTDAIHVVLLPDGTPVMPGHAKHSDAVVLVRTEVCNLNTQEIRFQTCAYTPDAELIDPADAQTTGAAMARHYLKTAELA